VRLNLNEALKEGGARAGFGRSHMRNFLVVSEVALSFILLVGAVLLIRSFVNVRWLDPGFQSKGVLTLHVSLSPSKYRDVSKGRHSSIRPSKNCAAYPAYRAWRSPALCPSYGRAAPAASWLKADLVPPTACPMMQIIASSVPVTCRSWA